jgi:hypothetical protein
MDMQITTRRAFIHSSALISRDKGTVTQNFPRTQVHGNGRDEIAVRKESRFGGWNYNPEMLLEAALRVPPNA